MAFWTPKFLVILCSISGFSPLMKHLHISFSKDSLIFDIGRATGLRVVRKVTRALFKVAHQFITWPSDEQAKTVIKKFKENSRFPNTIGAIDGMHIKIEAPKKNTADYVNRKRYHSIQLQILKIIKLFITILVIFVLYYY